MTISKDKTYKTRNGHPVRIYCDDAGGDYPVHGAFFEGSWIGDSWTKDGFKYFNTHETKYDLIEVKPVRTGWINIYRVGPALLFETKEAADMHKTYAKRIACIQITYTEGEGLDG